MQSTPGTLSRRLVLALLSLFVVLGSTASAPAQKRIPNGTNLIPSEGYHWAYWKLDEGELGDALERANKSLFRAPKGVNGRYIDAICYHVVIGESLYKQGRFPEALVQYDAALQQFLAWPNWPLKVDWPVQIRTMQRVAAGTPWGQSQRQNVQVADFGENVLMNRGGLIPIAGGALNNQQKFPMNCLEIIRATAVAMQRYRELSGPNCQFDPIVAQLDQALATTFPPNHYSNCFGDILRGLVARMNNSDGEAYALLQRGRLLDGRYDHPLTPIAFYEMASISMDRGDFAQAVDEFRESTFAQAYFLYPAGPTLIEQAFHNAFLCSLFANKKVDMDAMQAAANWASGEKLMHMYATLTLDGAEAAIVARDPEEAKKFLLNTQRAFARKDMRAGLIGTRFNHISAMHSYQTGNVVAGDKSMQEAFKKTSNGASHWLLQMQIANDRIAKGEITDIKALRLYEYVLRDPSRYDWLIDPLDALTMLRTPHDRVYENWFELAVQREDLDAAVGIADLARRHRFFQQLPLGGRLLGLRWILESPDDAQKLLQRDLFAQYPGYSSLAEQVTDVQKELRRLPWKVAEPQLQQQQTNLLQQLGAASQAQEAVLREMGVRREVSTLAFPMMQPVMEIRKEMKEGQLALVFFGTSRGMHVFQLGKLNGQEVYGNWRVPSLDRTLRPVQTLLRDLGNFGANRAMRAEDLASTDWRTSGREVLESIYGVQTMPEGIKELVVVPDGLFWYVPFEALQVPAGGDQTESLISKMQIRYVPMLSLVEPRTSHKTAIPNTAIAVGRMILQEPPELISEAAAAMERDISGAGVIPAEMPASSAVYGTLFDRMVILDEILESTTRPFGWSPLSTEKAGRGAITLADWFPLPFGAPQEMILPGYHTFAEDALKTQNAATKGDEVFLSVMGMMSCGTRTILLSRWRTGGQTCYDMVREFVKELDSMSAAAAWQRCVFLALQLPIDPGKEPRVNLVRKDEQFNADNPFFWAGYMLVDSGTLPPAELNAPGVIGNPPPAGAAGGVGNADGNADGGEPE